MFFKKLSETSDRVNLFTRAFYQRKAGMELEYMLKKYKEIEKKDLIEVNKGKNKRGTLIGSMTEIKGIEKMLLSIKEQPVEPTEDTSSMTSMTSDDFTVIDD